MTCDFTSRYFMFKFYKSLSVLFLFKKLIFKRIGHFFKNENGQCYLCTLVVVKFFGYHRRMDGVM